MNSDHSYNSPSAGWFRPEQTLQRHGLDLFPEEDSYLYIEGSSLKHQPCEKHLYWCMALVGNAYGFSSSRWNLLAGAENLVLQFKEMLSEQLQVGVEGEGTRQSGENRRVLEARSLFTT